MQNFDYQPIKYLFAVCLILTFLASCDEPKVDCLDIAATNFAADADDPCEDCCIFPNLEVQFLHRITQGDTIVNLQYDSAYALNGTDLFRIKNIRYLLSDLEFIRADGTMATVLDNVELSIPNAPNDTIFKTRPDNFVIVNANNFQSIAIANYRESGNFVGLRFNIGISEPDNQAIPTSLAIDHPLRADSLYLGTGLGYVFNQITFARDTTAAECTVVKISGEPNLKTVSLDSIFTARESFTIRVVLTVDYAKWFVGVDFQNDSAEQIAEKITANISDSFSIFDITN